MIFFRTRESQPSPQSLISDHRKEKTLNCNRYASFACLVIEKIRNFITKNFLPNSSMNSHKNLIEETFEERQKREIYESWHDEDGMMLHPKQYQKKIELKEFLKKVEEDFDENSFLPDNEINFTYIITGIISDGYLLFNIGSRCIKNKIEDFTKSSLELSDGNIIIMMQLNKKIDHAFPVWIVEFEESDIFYVREFCEGIHSEKDGPFYLIDKFENIQNLEIDDFFKYNYKNNPSSYNLLLARKKPNQGDGKPFTRGVYLGWLERWKNRF